MTKVTGALEPFDGSEPGEEFVDPTSAKMRVATTYLSGFRNAVATRPIAKTEVYSLTLKPLKIFLAGAGKQGSDRGFLPRNEDDRNSKRYPGNRP